METDSQPPLELLEENAIRAALDPSAAARLERLVLLDSVDSTNNWLRAQPLNERPGTAVLAESQTAGRGRFARRWVSPFGRNIYLSLGKKFAADISELSWLPVVVALSASDALKDIGMQGHTIKWPNDLLFDQRKLGGCLVEVQGKASGPRVALIGVGINVHMPADLTAAEQIDQPWTDVSSQVPGVSRNRLAGRLLNALLVNLERFSRDGFGPFEQRWTGRDQLAGEFSIQRKGNPD